MDLKSLLTEKKKTIVQKWIDQVLESYDSAGFFKKQKDRFANPVGSTISDGLARLYDLLVEDGDLAAAVKPLEDIIKIRAVQDFEPSQAVFFVFQLKRIVRQELAREKHITDSATYLAALDDRIDKVALMGFDFYMNCRERLHQIRVKELLSGRSALTDGTKCISGMLKQNQIKLADNNKNNRLT